MTLHRHTKLPGRLRAADRGMSSAQVVELASHPSRKAALSSDLDHLLTVLRSEVTIAIGVSQGLIETLARFQDHLAAIDDDIERGELSQLEGIVLSQTAALRATVRAVSADLHRVLPDRTDDLAVVSRPDRSDLIYS